MTELMMRGRRAVSVGLLTLAVVWASRSDDRAGAAEPAAEERVPLRDNFSPLETTTAITTAAGGLLLLSLNGAIINSPSPSLGVPDRDSLDARLSRWFYDAGGSGRRFLWRLPDRAGSVFPALPFVLYGSSALSLALRDQPLGPVGVNAFHGLVAYTEALGWTYFVTALAKYTVGRRRPYTEEANNHPELRVRRSEDGLSFFSSHASGAFAAGAFVAEDASRALRRRILVKYSPAVRFFLGVVAPYTVGYGLPALVAVSRIVDQQHWPSDVAVGALTGALIAHLTYATHFDPDGRPHRANRVSDPRIVPVASRRPDGIEEIGLAYVGRF